MANGARINAVDVGGLYIEIVDEPTLVGRGVGGTAGVSPADLFDRLDAVGERIGQICERLKTRALSTVGDARPDSLEIQFGLKLAGSAGIPLVSSGSLESSFTVKATWDLAAAQPQHESDKSDVCFCPT
jgi:hypothetical protein